MKNLLPLLLVPFLVGIAPSVSRADTCAEAPSGLVTWLPAEWNATDLAGTNHGTLQGGVSFPAGKVGRAFGFDGSDDSIDLGPWFNLQTFTIGLWVKAGSSQNTYADLIDNNHTGFRSWV